MKSKSDTSKWARVIGFIVTSLTILFVSIDLSRELKEGSEHFSNYLTSIFTSFYPWIDPIALVLIYFVGYAIVWWKQLWGSIIIITVSLLGLIFSEYDDVRILYILIFLVGLLYFVNWNDKRKNIA